MDVDEEVVRWRHEDRRAMLAAIVDSSRFRLSLETAETSVHDEDTILGRNDLASPMGKSTGTPLQSASMFISSRQLTHPITLRAL
jgi:hypothetical protein